MIFIRNEEKKDWREVEEITRDAFWNHFSPGCDEHYLVHTMRSSLDFIPELDFVAVLDNRIAGNIMYTKSAVKDPAGNTVPVITFGPISVPPALQKKGIGSALIRRSFDEALLLGHKAVIIFGDPGYYSRFGFEPGVKFRITNHEGKYPRAMMVRELEKGALEGVSGIFLESPVFTMDPEAVAEFDKTFPPREKITGTPGQVFFQRMSASYWEPEENN